MTFRAGPNINYNLNPLFDVQILYHKNQVQNPHESNFISKPSIFLPLPESRILWYLNSF